MTLYVPNIKSFFYKTLEEMEYTTEQIKIDGAWEDEGNMGDYSLQDLWLVIVTIKYYLM